MEYPVFQLKFTLTWWDLLTVTLRLTLRQKLLWIAATTLSAFHFWTRINQHADYGAAFASALQMFVVLVLIYFTAIPLMAMLRRARTAGLELTVDVLKSQLKVSHALAATEFKWNTIQSVSAGSERLYLDLGPGQMLMIPRRALPDATHWNQLIQYCRNRVAGKSA